MSDASKAVSRSTRNATREGVAKRLKRLEIELDDLHDAIECVLAERRRNDPQQDAHR